MPRRPTRSRGRHNEVLRQWQILKTLWESRFGKTVRALASDAETSERTVRRDLTVLTLAGFAIEPERRDGETVWKLDREQFGGLVEDGFTLPELCALHFSRSLLECLAGTPFHKDLRSAFEKIEETLPQPMWKYFEQLPAVLVSKADAPKRRGHATRAIISRLTEAMLEHRVVDMRYHSFTSRKVKDYTIEPHRMTYSRGGLYLHAWVPLYGQIRAFAVERMKDVSVREDRFTPHDLPSDPFGNSLGIYTGEAEVVDLEFTPQMAPYILEREWHKSQEVTQQPDGSVRMRMRVAVDWALKNWVLSFGGAVKVLEPSRLAQQILEELEEARALYAPTFDFDAEASPQRTPRGQKVLFRAGR